MACIDKLTAIADGFRASRGTTCKYSLDDMAILAAEPIGGGGSSSGTYEELLPEVDVPFTLITSGLYGFQTQSGDDFTLIPGEKYTVFWDGEKHVFKCEEYYATMDGQSVLVGQAIGNPSFFNIYTEGLTSYEDNGEELLLGVGADGTLMIATTKAGDTHTVQVYKGEEVVTEVVINVTNGKEWTEVERNTETMPAGFTQICYADGIWVGGYYGSGLWYSEDGILWTQSNITSNIQCIHKVNGVWFASSTSPVYPGVYRSEDGKNWTLISGLKSTVANHVFFFNGYWICIANSANIYYSIDCSKWEVAKEISDAVQCVCITNGMVVIGMNNTGLWYSVDGLTWGQCSGVSNEGFKSLHNANGIWIAGSYSKKGLYYSTNGTTWTLSNITTGNFYQLDYANGLWVTASYVTDSQGMLYSTDGKTWTQSNITTEGTNYLKYANGVWVCGSKDKGLWYSTDGKTWTQSNITTGYGGNFCEGNGLLISYSGSSTGKFVYSRAW